VSLVRHVSDAKVAEMSSALMTRLTTGKDPQRDIASIALRTLIQETPPGLSAQALAAILPAKLLQGISSQVQFPPSALPPRVPKMSGRQLSGATPWAPWAACFCQFVFSAPFAVVFCRVMTSQRLDTGAHFEVAHAARRDSVALHLPLHL